MLSSATVTQARERSASVRGIALASSPTNDLVPAHIVTRKVDASHGRAEPERHLDEGRARLRALPHAGRPLRAAGGGLDGDLSPRVLRGVVLRPLRQASDATGWRQRQ